MSSLSPLGVSIEEMPQLTASSIDLRNAEELFPGSGLYTIPMCSTVGATSLISEIHLPPREGWKWRKASHVAPQALRSFRRNACRLDR